MDTLTLDWDAGGSSIGVVTLKRPDALNAMNTLMIQELLTLFREQAYNQALRCVVLTGAGTRAFSTGGDLKERNGMTNDQWRHQHHLIEECLQSTLGVSRSRYRGGGRFRLCWRMRVRAGRRLYSGIGHRAVCTQGSHARNHAGWRRSAEPGSQYRDAAGP